MDKKFHATSVINQKLFTTLKNDFIPVSIKTITYFMIESSIMASNILLRHINKVTHLIIILQVIIPTLLVLYQSDLKFV